MEQYTNEKDLDTVLSLQSENVELVKKKFSRYKAPELLVMGRALDLIQSYSSGKYSDGYTGYYWER